MERTTFQPRDAYGRFERTLVRYSCDACQLMRINGLVCHEAGCPEAWRDSTSSCFGCGCDFQPESRGARYCSSECAS